MEAFLTAAGFIGILVLVLFLAYVCTRYIGRRGGLYPVDGGGTYADVIDRIPVGQDRAILLVRIAGKILVLGVTAHHIEKLDSLPIEQFPNLPEHPVAQGSTFSDTFRQALDGFGIKIPRKNKDDRHE